MVLVLHSILKYSISLIIIIIAELFSRFHVARFSSVSDVCDLKTISQFVRGKATGPKFSVHQKGRTFEEPHDNLNVSLVPGTQKAGRILI